MKASSVITLVLVALLTTNLQAEKSILANSWHSLDFWEPLNFPSIDKHTKYEVIKEEDDTHVLKATANASASGIIHKEVFDVYSKSALSWSWKVDSVYKKGDATKKSGDDYPARVYVLFEYDPEEASFFKAARYRAVKLLYGEYPPDTTLNYIWANKAHKEKFLVNAYTDDSVMFPLQAGDERLGNWIQERRNIVADYRLAYGKGPPKRARIAVMVDADNTEESAVSYFKDFRLD